MINLLIVDDELLIREGLKILLSVYEDIQVAGLCADGEAALSYCREHPVDVVLMDIRMPKCDGVRATQLIKELLPQIVIVILTTFQDDEYVTEALGYGASGYLLKDSSPDKIYEAVKGAYAGNIVINPDVLKIMINHQNSDGNSEQFRHKTSLQEKEVELIRLVAAGLNNKEIGEKLFITEGTVKNNISTILSKLALRDRTQLTIFAFKNNLVK